MIVTRKEVKVLDIMSSHLWADGELNSRPAHFQYQHMKAGSAMLSLHGVLCPVEHPQAQVRLKLELLCLGYSAGTVIQLPPLGSTDYGR